MASPAIALDASGVDVYRAACANCHGLDGSGADPALLAFEEVVPDFTDCNFASREPAVDWIGVAHDGGPSRGFSRMMPAFGDALTVAQLRRVMEYIRSFCGDRSWPRGELNLPRAFLTEKAYPEDEVVLTTDVALDGDGAVGHELVWERRLGARSQLEIVIPYGFRERRPEGSAGAAAGTEWVDGLGDVAVGFKRDVHHDFEAGRIVSVAAEVKLPTGDESAGFGAGTTVLEGFVSYGQILPRDVFVQLQGIVEVPVDQEEAENEAVWRGVIGRTFTRGRWGRAFSPMVEGQGKRELASGAGFEWDLLPQLQVSLNTRQHVFVNVGVLVPVTNADERSSRLFVYLLWDWFDGGFFEGW